MKKYVLSLLIITVPFHTQSISPSYNPYHNTSGFDDVVTALQTAAFITATVGLTYITGRIASTINLSLAQHTFKHQISLVQQRIVLGEDTFEAELKKTILLDHEKNYLQSFFCEKTKYRNYPLVRFKENLDHYISRLQILGLFHLGTETYIDIEVALVRLKVIRDFLIADYDFTKERRRFEEGYRGDNASTLSTQPAEPKTTVTIKIGL